MARHGLSRMFVVQFGLSPDPAKALRPVLAESLACVNTHDMPTFASFWGGLDIDDRIELGLLDEEGARKEREKRLKVKKALASFLRRKGWLGKDRPGAQAVLAACLSFLPANK